MLNKKELQKYCEPCLVNGATPESCEDCIIDQLLNAHSLIEQLEADLKYSKDKTQPFDYCPDCSAQANFNRHELNCYSCEIEKELKRHHLKIKEVL